MNDVYNHLIREEINLTSDEANTLIKNVIFGDDEHFDLITQEGGGISPTDEMKFLPTVLVIKRKLDNKYFQIKYLKYANELINGRYKTYYKKPFDNEYGDKENITFQEVFPVKVVKTYSYTSYE